MEGETTNIFSFFQRNEVGGFQSVVRGIFSKGRKGSCSASIYNWIKPFASDLGIRDILSTEIEVDGEGCLTGFFSNKNCYGQEKVVRLLEQIPDLENNYLIVYGDSKGDSQLLKYANESHYRAL